MLGSINKSPAHLQALNRVEGWTRERFELPREVVVLVSEVTCSLPGCPPLETVIAFWPADGKRRRFKVFKPVAEVVYDDLPFAWLLDALVDDGIDADCC